MIIFIFSKLKLYKVLEKVFENKSLRKNIQKRNKLISHTLRYEGLLEVISEIIINGKNHKTKQNIDEVHLFHTETKLLIYDTIIIKILTKLI